MSPLMRTALLVLALLPGLAACTGNKGGSVPSTGSSTASAAIGAGCYLGHRASGGDSILIRLDAPQDRELTGSMSISVPEKDRRSGSLHGVIGTDGIVRAVYRFMQEGMTDSVQIQFRQAPGAAALLLRPAAYDPGTGHEYPDSTQDVSIRLGAVSCE